MDIKTLQNMVVKRRDMGVVGIIIVVSQLFTSFQSSQNVSEQLEHFRDEFSQSQVDLEKYFVRKTDVAVINQKLDKTNEKLAQIGEQIKNLKSLVKDHTYTESETEPDIVGCVYRSSNHVRHDL